MMGFVQALSHKAWTISRDLDIVRDYVYTQCVTQRRCIFLALLGLSHGFAVYLSFFYRYRPEGEYTHLSTSQHFAILTAQAQIRKLLCASSSTWETEA